MTNLQCSLPYLTKLPHSKKMLLSVFFTHEKVLQFTQISPKVHFISKEEGSEKHNIVPLEAE